MSAPLACEIPENFLDDGLTKALVLSLVVCIAEVFIANFKSKFFVRGVELLFIHFLLFLCLDSFFFTLLDGCLVVHLICGLALG